MLRLVKVQIDNIINFINLKINMEANFAERIVLSIKINDGFLYDLFFAIQIVS
jgi:hypothetical protein